VIRVTARTRTTALVAGGQVAMNAAAYVFSLVAARLLIPAEFGAVTALLSILQMGVVASLGLQAAAARRIAVAPENRHETVGTVVRSTMLASLAVGAVAVALAPVITWVLHLDSVWPALLCAATLAPLTAMGGFMGIAQGSERWRAVTAMALANGFGRLIAGTVALVIDPTVVSAMIGIAVGAWAPVLVGARTLGVSSSADPPPSTLRVQGGAPIDRLAEQTSMATQAIDSEDDEGKPDEDESGPPRLRHRLLEDQEAEHELERGSEVLQDPER
jgi:hypothetical protein